MKTEKDNTLDFSSFEIVKKESFDTSDRIMLAFDTGKAGSMRISRAARDALGNPAYGQMLVNPKTRQMLLMGTNSRMANCFTIHSPSNRSEDKPIPCEGLLNRLSDLMGWKEGYTYKIPGNLMPVRPVMDEPTLLFDLNNTVMCENTNPKGAKKHERHGCPPEWSEQFGLEGRSAELLQGEHYAVV